MTTKSFTQHATEGDATASTNTGNAANTDIDEANVASRRSFLGKAGFLTAAGVVGPVLSSSANADERHGIFT
ncbi:MAG: twin-arginine translocation signal domain-containing protein [Methylococcaceae bacterium]|nr:twin-arginine translocation signal domain-containing protein [Methylococcaceae bacterium]MDP3902792.1 twin-arginine translocation signal domain-containing protein [Methylococcaceae bacterium]